MGQNYNMLAELQLRTEEKWILDALKTIRHQRNCLQIERLHLESMKAKLVQAARAPRENPEGSEPQDQKSESSVVELKLPSVNDLPEFNELGCNNLELNLLVPRHGYGQEFQEHIEEFDEEDDDDDFILDMDMIMNAGRKSKKNDEDGREL